MDDAAITGEIFRAANHVYIEVWVCPAVAVGPLHSVSNSILPVFPKGDGLLPSCYVCSEVGALLLERH